jgi:uncharacterized protein
MLPLPVAGKTQIAGWLAGLSDGENYGKMVGFRFPKGTFIDGPAQVEHGSIRTAVSRAI